MRKISVWIKHYNDVLTGVVLLLIVGVFYTQISKIRIIGGLSDNIGPRFFPTVVLNVLAIMSGLLILRGIFRARAKPYPSEKITKSGDAADAGAAMEPEEESAGAVKMKGLNALYKKIDDNKALRGWIAVIGVFLFVLLIRPLGYAVSAFIYLFIQMTLLGPSDKKKYWMYLVIAVLAAFGSYFLFRYLVNVSLPRGLLAFID